MRCKSCNKMLKAFDDNELCHICIAASKDTWTRYKDTQHILVTNKKVKDLVLNNSKE